MSGRDDKPRKNRESKSKGKQAMALMLKEKEDRELILARIDAVRTMQRAEGNFDCFGTATGNYCDQGACLHHAECLSISTLVAQPFP